LKQLLLNFFTSPQPRNNWISGLWYSGVETVFKQKLLQFQA